MQDVRPVAAQETLLIQHQLWTETEEKIPTSVLQHHAVSLDGKVTIMLMSQHLVITSNKMFATARLVEHWVHGDNFDWSVEVDNLIVFSVV